MMLNRREVSAVEEDAEDATFAPGEAAATAALPDAWTEIPVAGVSSNPRSQSDFTPNDMQSARKVLKVGMCGSLSEQYIDRLD